MPPLSQRRFFETGWPDGYESNPLYGENPDYNKNSEISPTQHPIYVSCPKRYWHISSSSLTRYSNPICHITSYCGGVTNLHNLVCEACKDAGLEDGKKARQQYLHEALCWANLQDLPLHTWMKLACLHNMPIHKMEDSDFCDIINSERTSHHTFANTMLELSMIVEEKVAAEIKGKTGTIMHDGWSIPGTMFVCLPHIW